MRIAFTKMHGLGNDFVVLDGRAETLPALDRAAVPWSLPRPLGAALSYAAFRALLCKAAGKESF